MFAPEAADVYPDGFRTYVNVEGISERLEGRSRPGHFRGVATVVLKLFEIVQPHFAYFGRKDAQQVTNHWRDDARFESGCGNCGVPDCAGSGWAGAFFAECVFERQRNGKRRRSLHRALTAAQNELAAGVRDAAQLQAVMRRIIEAEPLATVDYAEIVSADTFEPVVRVARSCYAVLAVFVGKTRLIDNLLIEPASGRSDELIFHL